MANDSKTDDYYPFRWKVADAVEDVFLLHRSKAIGVIALIGLAFIIVGFLVLDWGGERTQTDTAAPTSSPATTSPDDDPVTSADSSTSSAPTTTTTPAAPTTTTASPTTTAAPTTTSATPQSERAATPLQLASTSPGSIVELTLSELTITGGLEDDAAADAIVELVETAYANISVNDQLVVDDSFAGTDTLVFRLSAPDLFGYNSDALNPTYLPLIDQLAQAAAEADTWQIEVSGHTDDSGPAEGNQRLSERRAVAAAQRLISQGVDSGRVTSIGRGEDRPIADNGSEAGRLANRRVEFSITR